MFVKNFLIQNEFLGYCLTRVHNSYSKKYFLVSRLEVATVMLKFYKNTESSKINEFLQRQGRQ